MGKFKDLTGQVFGRLTVVEQAEVDKKYGMKWLCLCVCGNKKIILASRLISIRTRSCGCLAREITIERSKTHGKRNHTLYNVWVSMKSRCVNKRHTQYKDYGGRGITVCDRWLNSFENFFNDMGECPKGMSIDRIDNDGNYEPNNCRWATKKEQCRNRRDNNLITYKEDIRCIAEWSQILNIPENTIRNRLYRGWSPEECLFGKKKSKHNNDEEE